MIAYGIWATSLWWVALGIFFLTVVPVVALLAIRIVTELRAIRGYAADIVEHGSGIAAGLEPVPELETTRKLGREIRAGVERYGATLAALVEEES